MSDHISIKGARVHNLKNIDLDLPKHKLIVITGLSGSGKSSLAFDTLYAEGQRRYVESLSAYARQFLDRLDKPDVDLIEGLSPAISIDQKSSSHNPRSTVGTVTEIYDYLRLLFASIGRPHCPDCGRKVEGQSAQEIADHVGALPDGTQVTILAPVISGKKGEHQDVLQQIKQDGFTRVRVDGELHRLDQDITLKKTFKHDIDVVVDRLSIEPDNTSRLFESIETALRYGKGDVCVEEVEGDFSKHYSETMACSHCQISLPEINPRLFSFNSPYGACPECNGLGDKFDFDEDLIIEDEELSVVTATQSVLNLDRTIYGRRFEREGAEYDITRKMKVSDLTKKQRHFFLYGAHEYTGEFKRNKRGRWMNIPKYWEGVINNLRRRYKQTNSEGMRFFFRRYMSSSICNVCQGTRLNPVANSVLIHKKSVSEACHMPISELITFFNTLSLTKKEKEICKLVLNEIQERLSFLQNVGLSYLSLSRKANTLSGGETQRIRLATQIGSGLTGVLYVLDEPSIGLHQRDNTKLLVTLKRLRDLGNTLIVVEHDEETMREADHIVDIGPLAGRDGGRIEFSGTFPKLLKAKTLTAGYLNGTKCIEVPKKRRKVPKTHSIVLKGAVQHNLKKVNLKLPLSSFVAITGVSGSGKSTLILETLQKVLLQKLYKKKERPGAYTSISGVENIKDMITIDQSPIGRTPRSNPATYVGVFTPIRDLFTKTREARIRGYKSGRFSFNVKGGRCEACQGDGLVKIEMHFLADVYVTCDLCKGKRFNDQTLEVLFKGYSIYDVLEMTVNQAAEIFENIPQIHRKLKTVQDVGLGYIKLGQSATTLSGGEAQRVKLAKELSKRGEGKTLYLLDEPTTGLHFDDIRQLLSVLNRLVDAGNSLVVIEHNLDVIKTADYVVDLGPEGGDQGGVIVAEGTPEQVSKVSTSYTGQYLKSVLN